MTCRHSPDDPDCSSNRPYTPTYPPTTPDSKFYKIQQAAQEGEHLILMVEYPNCWACSFEGRKVMVFLNTNSLDALRWKEIDPHFSDRPRGADQAPSPAARFPASPEGWQDALAYARMKRNRL